jgi:hypothetical protein
MQMFMIVDLSDARLHPRRKRNRSEKLRRQASRLKSTKTKRLAASNISIRQALNC